MLPTFLIAGAMRSGTTSLASYLGQHPEVFMSARKELHYFDLNHDRGVGWYEAHFEGVTEERVVGEATPSYMYLPEARERMAELLPAARLLVSLRNPIDRAYSHYWLSRSRGEETLEFEEAVEAEPDRLRGAPPRERLWFSYIDRGRYATQLAGLYDLYPKDSIQVLLFEDLSTAPDATMARVFDFLDVDVGFTPRNLGETVGPMTMVRSPRARKLSRYLPKSARRAVMKANVTEGRYPALTSDVRARVAELFRDDVAAVSAMLGRDLSRWLE